MQLSDEAKLKIATTWLYCYEHGIHFDYIPYVKAFIEMEHKPYE